MKNLISRFVTAIIFLQALILSTSASAGWIFDHLHNQHWCVEETSCSLKSMAIPESALEALYEGETISIDQFDSDINHSGYAWINWQGKTNIFHLSYEL